MGIRLGFGGRNDGAATPATQNPVANYWLHQQNERWPSSHPNTQDPIDRRLRIRWAASPPHEHYHGGDTEIGDIFHSIVTTNVDPTGSPLARARRVVFSPPPGLYKVSIALSADAASTTAQLALKKVQDGADDFEYNSGFWFTSTNTPTEKAFLGGSATAFATQFEEFRVEDDDRFYWIIVDHNNVIMNLRGYMRLEKTP